MQSFKMNKVKNYLSLIKFSHTIFAMPFAMIGCPQPLKGSNETLLNLQDV